MPTTTRRMAASSVQAASSPAGTQNSKKPEKMPVRIKDHKHVSIEIPISTPSGTSKGVRGADEDGDVFKTPMERRHITFDDSDHDEDEFVTPREAPPKNPLEEVTGAKDEQKDNENQDDGESEEDEDDSDDEAPEAVSTSAAQAQVTQAAKAAATAAKQQAESERRKRQERDAFFRQQAEEKKRAKEEAAASKEDEPEEAPKVEAKEKRKREVPKLLPLELLESDSEDETAQQSRPTGQGDQKRRKLASGEKLVRDKKHPKDQKVGSTVLRVVKQRGDERVAPRVNKQSVNLKELLMKRDKKPLVKRGFFVK
ncbi:hypothetical protein V8F20_008756 [Naviculisporaceae sp. PSN 640]